MASNEEQSTKKQPRWRWTTERKLGLLRQVVFTGKKAFMTVRGARADDDFVSQTDVWTNDETGILPILFRNLDGTTTFTPTAGETHPTHNSTITALKKWLSDNSHLYTQGKEQSEPVDIDHPTDTTGTKAEEELSEYQSLLITVAELKREADLAAKERQAEKAAEAAARLAQDAVAKKTFARITEEELQAAEDAAARCPANGRNSTSPSTVSDDLPDRMIVDEWLAEYAPPEVTDACMGVEELRLQPKVWPTGFTWEGPNDDGKNFFVRVRASRTNAKGKAAASTRDSFADMVAQRKQEVMEERQAERALAARDWLRSPLLGLRGLIWSFARATQQRLNGGSSLLTRPLLSPR